MNTNPNVLSTTAGELTLEEVQLRVEDHSWRILHTGAIVSHADEQRFLTAETRLPYGIALWPSAIALAHEIATRPFQNLRVLELGAGTGLPGIVAASLGAHVVQTDARDIALFVAKMNAELNGVTSIERRVADWTAWDDRETYDAILGSDILYGESVHPDLLRIFESNLAPNGTIFIADPFRKASMSLLEATEAKGFSITMNKWTISHVPPPRPVGVYEIKRHHE